MTFSNLSTLTAAPRQGRVWSLADREGLEYVVGACPIAIFAHATKRDGRPSSLSNQEGAPEPR